MLQAGAIGVERRPPDFARGVRRRRAPPGAAASSCVRRCALVGGDRRPRSSAAAGNSARSSRAERPRGRRAHRRASVCRWRAPRATAAAAKPSAPRGLPRASAASASRRACAAPGGRHRARRLGLELAPRAGPPRSRDGRRRSSSEHWRPRRTKGPRRRRRPRARDDGTSVSPQSPRTDRVRRCNKVGWSVPPLLLFAIARMASAQPICKMPRLFGPTPRIFGPCEPRRPALPAASSSRLPLRQA